MSNFTKFDDYVYLQVEVAPAGDSPIYKESVKIERDGCALQQKILRRHPTHSEILFYLPDSG